MLSLGIIGLPNVGKSSLFNALTSGAAGVSNYPFTTIDSNVGMVPVPDERLERLAAILHPDETTPAHVRFIDIAGLVEGASRGEGLGNQFLGEIRQVDAVVHVVRCFEDAEVAHVFGSVDPARDAEVVETELLLADLELLERLLEKREREWKADPEAHAGERERFAAWRRALEAGTPLRRLDLERSEERELKGLGLLSGKPVLYAANVDEDDLGGGLPAAAVPLVARIGDEARVIPVSARLEAELAQLEPGERAEMMAALGLEESGLERLIAAGFDLLGLIRFYTVANDKLRAWEVERGTRAPGAAGTIHSDMEEGFIRARVISAADLLEHGDPKECARRGLVRTEGKEYVVRDGDVVEVLFSE